MYTYTAYIYILVIMNAQLISPVSRLQDTEAAAQQKAAPPKKRRRITAAAVAAAVKRRAKREEVGTGGIWLLNGDFNRNLLGTL
jgi:hypothetical protein